MSLSAFNFGSPQMKVFLRDFLQNIRSLIFQIKTHVFEIANLDPDYHCLQNPKVYPNFHSILKNCTQTHQDLKRINYMLKGCTANNREQEQQGSPLANFFKQIPNRCYSYANNISFQKIQTNQIISSSKTDGLIYDALTINSQNDLNRLNTSNSKPKIHLRNKTQSHFDNGKSDKDPTDAESYTEALTKRTSFTTLRNKSPDIGLRGTIDSVNEISQFSVQHGFSSKVQKESAKSNNTQRDQQRNESLSFTFNEIPAVEESMQKSRRCPKIQEQNARRDSKCLEIIKSIRKELSR